MQDLLKNCDRLFRDSRAAPEDENYCYDCEQFKVLRENEAMLVCENCGKAITTCVYLTGPAMGKYYGYSRYNHFCKFLANIQAKESYRVPDNVINTVRHDLEELIEVNIKRCLKKHKYSRYYNNIPQILFRLTEYSSITNVI